MTQETVSFAAAATRIADAITYGIDTTSGFRDYVTDVEALRALAARFEQLESLCDIGPLGPVHAADFAAFCAAGFTPDGGEETR